MLTSSYTIDYHIKAFEKLCDHVKDYTNKIVISFLDYYNNTSKNMQSHNVFNITTDDMHKLAEKFSSIAKSHNITLESCAEKIDLENNIYELSAKDFEENPFTSIRKYIAINGEYIGKVIAFPKNNSGIIVQLDNLQVTVLTRVPARFNSFPHFADKVLIRITEIKEDKKYIYGYLVRII